MVLTVEELRLLQTTFQQETIALCDLIAFTVIYPAFNDKTADLTALRVMLNKRL